MAVIPGDEGNDGRSHHLIGKSPSARFPAAAPDEEQQTGCRHRKHDRQHDPLGIGQTGQEVDQNAAPRNHLFGMDHGLSGVKSGIKPHGLEVRNQAVLTQDSHGRRQDDQSRSNGSNNRPPTPGDEQSKPEEDCILGFDEQHADPKTSPEVIPLGECLVSQEQEKDKQHNDLAQENAVRHRGKKQQQKDQHPFFAVKVHSQADGYQRQEHQVDEGPQAKTGWGRDQGERDKGDNEQRRVGDNPRDEIILGSTARAGRQECRKPGIKRPEPGETRKSIVIIVKSLHETTGARMVIYRQVVQE